jgi:hypothetical protein
MRQAACFRRHPPWDTPRAVNDSEQHVPGSRQFRKQRQYRAELLLPCWDPITSLPSIRGKDLSPEKIYMRYARRLSNPPGEASGIVPTACPTPERKKEKIFSCFPQECISIAEINIRTSNEINKL